MRDFSAEPPSITFDKSKELQALGWAASEMRATHPDDPEVTRAYQDALKATHIRHDASTSQDFTLRGARATDMLSVLQRWVAQGPPRSEGQIVDAARAKSYKTARKIVSHTVELTKN